MVVIHSCSSLVELPRMLLQSVLKPAIGGNVYMSEVTELAEKLKSEGEKMVSIFSGMNDSLWQQEVYTEGTTWTIRNVLSHFVTSERGLVKLFEQIRLGGAGSADDF